MKVILLNDKQRKAIINMARPSAGDYYSYQNLNLLTAVYDEEKNVCLTVTRYMSSAITRMGSHCDEYSFALLTPLGCFSVSCTEAAGKYSDIFSPLPLFISGKKIAEMIEYYHDSFSQRRALEKEALKDIDTGGSGFTEWYLQKSCFKKNRRD
ncbi:hypothetical protein [Huintestinicola sp.]|uniref:hypothetical protein n=1 Tax=Huintestinicola sp. TaxID=2981661 RepID=UPI003D7C72E9